MSPGKKILVVEDDYMSALLLKENLGLWGFQICGHASFADEAVSLAENARPDVVLIDAKLRGELRGPWAAKEILARFDIPVIIISGYPEAEIRKHPGLERAAFMDKSMEMEKLKDLIDSITGGNQATAGC
ncbi:MAG: response regulator [Actinomycetota bacterium]|nr:response regulator [Actinomycetota bacterium]